MRTRPIVPGGPKADPRATTPDGQVATPEVKQLGGKVIVHDARPEEDRCEGGGLHLRNWEKWRAEHPYVKKGREHMTPQEYTKALKDAFAGGQHEASKEASGKNQTHLAAKVTEHTVKTRKFHTKGDAIHAAFHQGKSTGFQQAMGKASSLDFSGKGQGKALLGMLGAFREDGAPLETRDWAKWHAEHPYVPHPRKKGETPKAYDARLEKQYGEWIDKARANALPHEAWSAAQSKKWEAQGKGHEDATVEKAGGRPELLAKNVHPETYKTGIANQEWARKYHKGMTAQQHVAEAESAHSDFYTEHGTAAYRTQYAAAADWHAAEAKKLDKTATVSFKPGSHTFAPEDVSSGAKDLDKAKQNVEHYVNLTQGAEYSNTVKIGRTGSKYGGTSASGPPATLHVGDKVKFKTEEGQTKEGTIHGKMADTGLGWAAAVVKTPKGTHHAVIFGDGPNGVGEERDYTKPPKKRDDAELDTRDWAKWDAEHPYQKHGWHGTEHDLHRVQRTKFNAKTGERTNIGEPKMMTGEQIHQAEKKATYSADSQLSYGPHEDKNPESPWQGSHTVNHGYYGMTEHDGSAVVNGVGNVTGQPRWVAEGFKSGAEGKAWSKTVWGNRGGINGAIKGSPEWTKAMGGGAKGMRLSVNTSPDGKSLVVGDYDYDRLPKLTVPIAPTGKRSEEDDMETRAAGYQPEPYSKSADETVTCPSCGKADAPDARYCDQCGFKLAGAEGVKTRGFKTADQVADSDGVQPKDNGGKTGYATTDTGKHKFQGSNLASCKKCGKSFGAKTHRPVKREDELADLRALAAAEKELLELPTHRNEPVEAHLFRASDTDGCGVCGSGLTDSVHRQA